MATREVTCWTIRYAADPFRQEHRNIGVLVHGQGETHLAMLGDQPSGDSDARYFCRAFGYGEAVSWVFREWERWFKALAMEARTAAEIQDELNHLAKSGARFDAGEPINAIVPAGESPLVVARRLFGSMVTVPKIPKRSTFQHDVDDTFRRSELEFVSTFHRDVELEIEVPGQPQFVRLAAFVEAPVPLGIKLLRFNGRTAAEVADQANDVLYGFAALTAHGILGRDRCIVLHDEPKARLAHLLQRIAGAAMLLPLNDPETPHALRRLVHAD